jgi:hypothetical protein
MKMTKVSQCSIPYMALAVAVSYAKKTWPIFDDESVLQSLDPIRANALILQVRQS